MAEKKECGQISEKTFAYQQPDVLKRFEDGFILRQMTYEDTRFVNINIPYSDEIALAISRNHLNQKYNCRICNLIKNRIKKLIESGTTNSNPFSHAS